MHTGGGDLATASYICIQVEVILPVHTSSYRCIEVEVIDLASAYS